MRKFPDGTDTNFVSKIWASLLTDPHYYIKPECDAFIGQEFVKNADNFFPKIHTIRKGRRWRAGNRIHFKQWTGAPYRSKTFCFAPTYTCASVQNVAVEPPTACSRGRLYIDGKELIQSEIEELAINDGFDSADCFFKWFNEETDNLQLIHWTSKRY